VVATVKAREAATVTLVRDARGDGGSADRRRRSRSLRRRQDGSTLEVFMLRRNLEADFMGGAYVFPGGAVDAEDRAPELLARCHGRDDAGASAALGLSGGGLGFWVAAVREAFEEAGVLLARSASTGRAIDLDDATLAGRVRGARQLVGRGERPFVDVVQEEDLLLDAGALHLLSHWITPAGAPRRYDTWFFVAAAPDGHAYLHDDSETVASEWVRPGAALDRAERGDIELIFPTVRNLEQLARFTNARDLLDTVALATTAARPRMIADATGSRVLLPIDPGFDEGVA
jgi:8-oxo-dGTP pyrophosphatase MutT (NUDIX family)